MSEDQVKRIKQKVADGLARAKTLRAVVDFLMEAAQVSLSEEQQIAAFGVLSGLPKPAPLQSFVAAVKADADRLCELVPLAVALEPFCEARPSPTSST